MYCDTAAGSRKQYSQFVPLFVPYEDIHPLDQTYDMQLSYEDGPWAWSISGLKGLGAPDSSSCCTE